MADVRIQDYFDGLYESTPRYWWSGDNRYDTDPNSYTRSLLTQMTLRLLMTRPPGRALDLGAGEGSDAIRLALLGYEVDAVEISPVAAEKIGVFAEEQNVTVNVQVADALNFQPDGLYDVVICNGVLHYVEDKTSVIQAIQNATSPGGLNVISSWSDYTRILYHNSVPTYLDAEDGIIVKHYQGWRKEFLYFDRDKPETSHSDLPMHTHSHIKLIARAPS